jgi:hypothetical protein
MLLALDDSRRPCPAPCHNVLMRLQPLITLCGFLASPAASASTNYPLAILLERAKTVVLVTLEAHDATTATFACVTLYRGTFERHQTFQLEDDDDQALPKGVKQFIAFSQGDDANPPTNQLEVRQYVKGQGGYRGWIVYPVVRRHGHDIVEPDASGEAPTSLDDLRDLLDHHPYRKHGK